MSVPAASPARSPRFSAKAMLIPLALMLGLWGVAIRQWQQGMSVTALLLLLYVGLFIGVGIGTYIALPMHRRQLGRRLILLFVGALLLVVAFASDHGNMQIEGFFFAILMASPWILLHYALAKVIGPLLFGRIWCGWACWFAMIFDLLPYPHSRYRVPGPIVIIRCLLFTASMVLVLVLWLLGFRDGAEGATGMRWFAVGLAAYYGVGVALAFALRDNRAFCKYVCPIGLLAKIPARFALLKISGTAAKCDSCNVCVELCPMNVRVPDYILNGERVLSTECTLCLACINVCPRDALGLSLRVDRGGKELLDYVPPRQRRA